MLRLGLTGSIATGKSTTLRAFADLGVPVFSSDEAVHELYRGEAVPPVERLFPGVARDGIIDRTELSRRLLAEPARLAELEAVVHPLVRARMSQFLDLAERNGAKLAVVDIPLLYETGFDYGLDKVAVTWCDPAIQRERALRRPAMTVDKLDAILARQMPQDEKKKRADYLFDTGRPVEAVRAEVRTLVEKLNAGQ
ncbi:dephospho-CoA kinase [Youhaiella tibetensis]|uniref:Dephospho-CoA kinase n=1 Tax=Paradevosia tibetensis TaxID=1447062 RepID=A0A5B9DTN2_9HYPH|nr:dephospho-CoA kinase [Youhaiella tibetensis]AKR57574.1 dephospho-CoA kinase [Devosia sp. H5989]QEE22503.1 dephospho-CoA kinase [Youhaiella tibetensis]GGF41735.1 dephospho-CoA kinase [Youhaiella tibetensis]